MWAGMERNIAIMVASVPALRPLVEPVMKFTSRNFTPGRKQSSDPHSYELGGLNNFQRLINEGDRHAPIGSGIVAVKKSRDSQGESINQEHMLPIQTHQHL